MLYKYNILCTSYECAFQVGQIQTMVYFNVWGLERPSL